MRLFIYVPVLGKDLVKIHREGYLPLVVLGTVLLIVNLMGAWLPDSYWQLGIAVLSLLGVGLVAQFFRNPDRVAPECEDCVISPADGTIVAIERTYEPEYFAEDRLKISIFMSVVNVHVNRVPVDGKLVYYKYHPGRYLMAFHPKSSELNERNTIVIELENGRQILMRQIAGFLARRVCFYLTEEQMVRSGQELGFIRFGSRCDLFLPPDVGVDVKLQQKVIGGETILARL